MKAFRFTLEAVRVVRQRQEETALEQYAQALLARQQAADRLQSAQEELKAAWRHQQDLLASGATAAQLQQIVGCSQFLENRAKALEKALQEAVLAEERRRQQYLAARQQREIVDKYREKQKAQYDLVTAREDQKTLDELAVRMASTENAASVKISDMLWN